MTAQVLTSHGSDDFSNDFDAYSRRDSPFAHPSWLAKGLAGDRQCLYSMYGQANYFVPKQKSTFDFEGYKLRHQAALTAYVEQLRREGFEVFTEDSNACKLNSKAGAVISAQPDIVAIRGDEVIIIDIKTGSPASKDIAQVKLYMAIAPAVNLHGIQATPMGRLVYADDEFDIEPEEITPEFKVHVAGLIQPLALPDPPPPTPSARECAWCPVAHVCSHKVSDVAEGEADWL